MATPTNPHPHADRAGELPRRGDRGNGPGVRSRYPAESRRAGDELLQAFSEAGGHDRRGGVPVSGGRHRDGGVSPGGRRFDAAGRLGPGSAYFAQCRLGTAPPWPAQRRGGPPPSGCGPGAAGHTGRVRLSPASDRGDPAWRSGHGGAALSAPDRTRRANRSIGADARHLRAAPPGSPFDVQRRHHRRNPPPGEEQPSDGVLAVAPARAAGGGRRGSRRNRGVR